MANDTENFMQHATLKPTLQIKISHGVAQRNAQTHLIAKFRLGEEGPKRFYCFYLHLIKKEQNKNIVKKTLGVAKNLLKSLWW